MMPINDKALVFNSILLDYLLILYVGKLNYMKDHDKRKCIIIPENRYKRSDANVIKSAVASSLVVFNAVYDYCLSNRKARLVEEK